MSLRASYQLILPAAKNLTTSSTGNFEGAVERKNQLD